MFQWSCSIRGLIPAVQKSRYCLPWHTANNNSNVAANAVLCSVLLLAPMIVRNRLLGCMSPRLFAQLSEFLEPVALKRRAILQEHNRPIEHAYFIERGVASLVARTQRDGPVGISMVGRFGFVGVAAVLGTMRSPHRCVVQIPGEALRIGAQQLYDIAESVPGIRHHLCAYIHAVLAQDAQLALCNVRHGIEQRVARWLLLASDRLDEVVVPVTHDQLAMLLGVRRAGITVTLSALQELGAVKKTRGAIEIVDRAALARETCQCYRIVTFEFEKIVDAGSYEHVIGPVGSEAGTPQP
jgi:CRP-like cAMP-binding protein